MLAKTAIFCRSWFHTVCY